MQILLVSATPFEIQPFLAYLSEHFTKAEENTFLKNELQIEVLITGVGIPLTAYHLGRVFAQKSFDLAINAGIAGAFNRNLQIGDTVNVISEQFGDLGIEEADGSFTDLFENKLLSANDELFSDGKLLNPTAADFTFLPPAKGLTINKVHGYPPSIDAIRKKYEADTESMEGAAFFLACRQAGVKFLEIRSVSNYVEKRNREAWNLPLSVHNLNKVLTKMAESLAG